MMVILGIGSNIGDRLAHLRKAIAAIAALPDVKLEQVSPVYVSDALLPENAPDDWDMPYLNLAVRMTTLLAPLDLLKALKNIEWSIGRKPEVRHWGPRILDIDILAYGNEIIESDILTVPHANLQQRPFALWPLADIAPLWTFPLPGSNHGLTAAQMVEGWGSRFTGEAPFHTRQINHRVDTPRLMGILNVTPDSFSDGGKFTQVDQALKHALQLIEAGAEVLDIGAESTSPRAQPLTPEEEWRRLEPVLIAIAQAKKDFFLPPTISIDTRHVQVASKSRAYGIDWINDVTGLDNPAMRELVASGKEDCVVMHHHSIPERRDDVLPRTQDPALLTLAWAEKRIAELEKSGIGRERIIFDPGIGFAKVAEQSLLVLKATAIFKQLGTRILVGTSRKTFLTLFTELSFAERDVETIATVLFLAKQPIDYIRIHNVDACARAIKVMQAIE